MTNLEALKKLKNIDEQLLQEDQELYKGIFWIKNSKDYSDNDLYFQTPCDMNGNTVFDNKIQYSSNDGLSFNHKRTWDNLPKDRTERKEFDYYPRGRVEIHNGIADIYCNPHICTDELKEWAIEKFNLTSHNGIKEVRLKADNSKHYQCYLDK